MLVWHRKNIQPWNTPRRKLQHNSVLPSKVSIFNNQLKGMECNTVSIKIVLSYKLHLISKFYKMKTTFIDLMSQRCFYEFTWTVNAQSRIFKSQGSKQWNSYMTQKDIQIIAKFIWVQRHLIELHHTWVSL